MSPGRGKFASKVSCERTMFAEQLVEVAVLPVDAADRRRDLLARGRQEARSVADVRRRPRGRSRRRRRAPPARRRSPRSTRSCTRAPIVAGSTPLTAFSPSPTSCAWSPRIDELSVTPGACEAASPAPIGTVSQPLCEVITWLVPSCLRSAVSSLASRPLPKTATKETSVRPIISAAAVEAVRPGFRTAFSCASRPAAPPSRATGQADDVGERADEARCDHREPDEDAERAAADPERPHAGRDVGAERAVDEAEGRQRSATTSPKTSVFRDCRLTTMPPSRTAAIGAIRVARTAGQTDGDERHQRAGRASRRPPSATGRPCRPAAARGRATRRARSAPSRAGRRARARPPRRRGRGSCPRASTERSTCRREAPSVRSVASSFVRCATVIESVLKMTNAPTNSAIPPNASRK